MLLYIALKGGESVGGLFEKEEGGGGTMSLLKGRERRFWGG